MERSELAADLAAILDACEGREPLASEQRKIDYLRQQIEECDRDHGLERLHALTREWDSREAEIYGIPDDDYGNRSSRWHR
jgi:hypothetical protein